MEEKRLERPLDDIILGGVCSGLGKYFSIDPVLVRVAFLFAFFGLGSGGLIYLLLWVVMPEATQTGPNDIDFG